MPPLIIRTYCPDPGLDPTIFAHHGQGANSPKYNPKEGRDVPGEYKPIKGIPAAIAVNHGPGLSYVFDTTELVTGKELSKHAGFERNLKIKVASAAAGEDVFNAYGCIACHTTDGSLGHGPTFFRLAESVRPLADGSETKADDAYLRRAIKTPNADIVKGFPPNYMPPIPPKDVELDALILFIQSLTGE